MNASEHALNLGNALLTNIVMIGALFGTGLLPLERSQIEEQLKKSFKGEKLSVNLRAFELGYGAVEVST